MPARDAASSPSAFFSIGVAVIVAPVVALCGWLAFHEWFKHDDFQFLVWVQNRGWDWGEVLLPMGEGRFWAYRPMGLDGFLWAGQRLFGGAAEAYFLTSLAFRFAAGAVLYRLLRQLDFAPTVALFTAVLSATRAPSMASIWWATVFGYMGTILFTALSLSWFLDGVRRGQRGWQIASLAMMALALANHEFGVAIAPMVVVLSLFEDGFRFDRAACLRAARRAAPFLVLGAVYAVFRATVVAPIEDDHPYTPGFSLARFSSHAWRLVVHVFEQDAVLVGLMAAVAVVLAWAATSSAGRAHLRAWFAPRALVFVAWWVVSLAPFLMLPFAHQRYAMAIETPMCAFLGLVVHVPFTLLRDRHPRAVEVALLVLLLLAMPVRPLLARATDPTGGFPRHLVAALDALDPPMSQGAQVVVLYGVDELAGDAQVRRFIKRTFGGNTLLQALYHAKQPSLRFFRPGADVPGPRLLHEHCIYLTLAPDYTVAVAPDGLVEREVVRRALAHENPRVFRTGARELLLRRGDDALAAIESACAVRADVQGEACLDALADGLRSEGEGERGRAAAARLEAARARAG